MAATGQDNTVRVALGRVLTRRFEDGKAKGTQAALGEALGAKSEAAAQRGWRLCSGQIFPDRDLPDVAAYVGLSLPGLLRLVTAEIVAMDRESRARQNK